MGNYQGNMVWLSILLRVHFGLAFCGLFSAPSSAHCVHSTQGLQIHLKGQFRPNSSQYLRPDSLEKCHNPIAVWSMGMEAASDGMLAAVTSILWSNRILSEYEHQEEIQRAALCMSMDKLYENHLQNAL